MEQIRVLHRLVATIACLVCLTFSVGMCSESDTSLIKTYVSSSLPSNNQFVDSTKLKVTKISGSEWDSLVIKSKLPVMVTFTADLCSACRAQSSVLDDLNLAYKDRFKFYTLNTDEERALDLLYKIRTLPTTIVFKGGEEMARVPGFQVGELIRLVEKYM